MEPLKLAGILLLGLSAIELLLWRVLAASNPKIPAGPCWRQG